MLCQCLFFSLTHITCMALHHTVVIRYSTSVTYRTLTHASGHLVIYCKCYGFERAQRHEGAGFFGKNIEKKHHDKNYCYFCKSNILVINLIVGSRNMIKVSKKYAFVNNFINGESRFHQIPTIS